MLWKWVVAACEGKSPSSWNSSMTSCLLLSRVRLREEEDFPSLGVLGDEARLSHCSPDLNTSGLKSGPKKVVPVSLDVDLGVETVERVVWGVLGVLGVLGVALASEPRSSSAKDIFRFFL